MMEKTEARSKHAGPLSISTAEDKKGSEICPRCVRGNKACSIRPLWPIATCAAFKPDPGEAVIIALGAIWNDYIKTQDFKDRMEKAEEIARLNLEGA